jgi:hypothetical protein
MEPGAERGVSAEARELLPHAHEHVLRELVDVAPAGHPPDQAVDARQVEAVELLECADVTRRGVSHVVGQFGAARCGAVRALRPQRL